jgi:hypothetical protein
MSNDSFIETRNVTYSELFIVMILENMEAHGINGDFYGYWIDLIYLGKRGIFRILCKDKDRLLIGKRFPPRVRRPNEKERML